MKCFIPSAAEGSHEVFHPERSRGISVHRTLEEVFHPERSRGISVLRTLEEVFHPERSRGIRDNAGDDDSIP